MELFLSKIIIILVCSIFVIVTPVRLFAQEKSDAEQADRMPDSLYEQRVRKNVPLSNRTATPQAPQRNQQLSNETNFQAEENAEAQAPFEHSVDEPVKRKTTESEFFFQAKKYQNILGLQLFYATSNFDVTPDSYSITKSDTRLQAYYEFGILDQLSFGVQTDFGQESQRFKYNQAFYRDHTINFKGLGDTLLFIKFSHLINSKFSSHYGVQWGIHSDKSKYPGVDTSVSPAQVYSEGNRSSGGMSLLGYFGFQWKILSNHSLGSKVSYGYNFERKLVIVYPSYSTEIQINGGNIFTIQPYYELSIAPFVFDFSFGYRQKEKEQYKSIGSSPKILTDTSSIATWLLAIEGLVKINPSFYLQAKFNGESNQSSWSHSYLDPANSIYDSTNTTNAYWDFIGQLGFRFLF